MPTREGYQRLFAKKATDSREGLRIISTYWDIDRFIDWLPDAYTDFLPAIELLAALLVKTRELVATPAYEHYLRQPIPAENEGKPSQRQSIAATCELSREIAALSVSPAIKGHTTRQSPLTLDVHIDV